MPHIIHDIGVANQIGSYSDAVEAAGLRGVTGLRGPGRLGWLPTQAPHRSGSARHNASFVTKPRSHQSALCGSMGSRRISGCPSCETVVPPLPCSVSTLPGASVTAVIPSHRPRRPTGRAVGPGASEPSHAAPSPGACSLTFEARGPGSAATTRGDRAALSRSSPGSARHGTTASAPTYSCSPSGTLACDTLPR